MKKIIYIACIVVAVIILHNTSLAQESKNGDQLPAKGPVAQESKNGYQLPAKGTVKVLIVFAELVGGCGDNGSHSDWPTGSAAPPKANLYIDAVVSANPSTYLTRYYKDMSLGENNVIGDYYDGTVQVPCALFKQYGTSSAIRQLNIDWQLNGGNYLTKNGLNLNEFDNYAELSNGFFKQPGITDDKIDATVILWRNHPTFTCGSGYGVGNPLGNIPLKNKFVNLYGSWDFCPYKLNNGYDEAFVAEYFHALQGSNNFHTGSGEASGSLMFNATGSYSMSAQSGSASRVVSGWDRNFLGIKGTRQYQISAKDLSSGNEVPSDLSTPTLDETFYILDDFVTVGDAIRIKLPHFNWYSDGDKKNQYLWLENHQLVNEFDHNKGYYSGCDSWSPGLYCYIQVGKDLISGSSVYGGPDSSRNELNDWLFPLPAEGRWDQFYSYLDTNINSNTCAWDNASVPYSNFYPDGSTKSNPFTGFTDAYGFLDTDDNGVINGSDVYQPQFQKWRGTPTVGSPPLPTIPRWGDEYDAFTTINQKISIATNPSPMPVYTLIEGGSIPQTYDNRSIHLNNLSITIYATDHYGVGSSGPKSMLIGIKWDDKIIDNDVRWCGNIVLENDPSDPFSRPMEISIDNGKTITVDKGLSPVKLYENTPGSRDFSEPSFLHLLNGTITTLKNGAKLNVINGSTLHVQTGATLIIGPNATVEIDATSKICIEPGAIINFQDANTSQIIIDGDSYKLDHNLQNITMTGDYFAINNITTATVTMPSSGDVLLQAGNKITMNLNTAISVGVAQQFIARIYDPNDCSNVNNYNLRVGINNPNQNTMNLDNFTNETVDLIQAKSLENSKLFSIYPNPNTGQFNVAIANNDANGLIEVFDLMGKKVFTQHNANGKTTIDITHQPKGIYLVRITIGDEVFNEKMVYH